MCAGVQYVGVCANAKHKTWVRNVLDRAALKQILTQDAPLFDASLAAQIKEHFMDIVNSLGAQGGEEEKEETDEEEEEDAKEPS